METMPKTVADFDAVIFDMDGLLIDTESLAMLALAETGKDMGYDMPESFCTSMIGVPVDHCRKLVTERFGHDFPLDTYFLNMDRRFVEMIDAGRLQLKIGVFELLATLEKHGIAKAVATSSSRAKADKHLAHVGIRDRFDAIVTRDDVEHGKPYPDPYLRAAERLGLSSERCLALEDSYNGVRAAHAANMRVIMVPDLLGPTDEMHAKALMVAKDLHFICGLVEDMAKLRSAA